ncbi:MAG: hypothetical protein RI995_353 [Bacteroidota bacterium]|jgi:hypothetical protein
MELDVREKIEIDGGNPIIIGLAAGWLGTIIYECVNDWNNNCAAFQAGRKSVR